MRAVEHAAATRPNHECMTHSISEVLNVVFIAAPGSFGTADARDRLRLVVACNVSLTDACAYPNASTCAPSRWIGLVGHDSAGC